MLVEVAGRSLLMDGTPAVIAAGEIHPFRLPRDGWARRLDLLVEAGADTVAAYVPWVVHERADGTIDVTGSTRPELDVGAFLDLAAGRGLRAIVRPGPFTMAELRHEGVPRRVLAEHPELEPVGWDGAPGTTADLDVGNPVLLAAAERWYAALGPVLGPRTAPKGGPVIAVQLDNEVGMLAWVSNTPPLTEHAVRELAARVGGHEPYPPADAPLEEWLRLARSADPAIAADLRADLADLARDRAARYLDGLAHLAERCGFGDVPLAVNVHGTESGSARNLSIGTAQLEPALRGRAGRFAGSDHYIGDVSFAGAVELVAAHAFLAAAVPDAPLTSLEHEAGTGDYGGDLGASTGPEATVLKTRLLLAQGVRAFNWYLFAGGTNRIDPRAEDTAATGHRFGITGERHGAAAPVTPEGERGPAFAPTAEAMALVRQWGSDVAVWLPETDGVRLAWVPEHWSHVYTHPHDEAGRALGAETAWGRGTGPRGLLGRMLAANAVRFDAVEPGADSIDAPVLALGTGDALPQRVQAAVVGHLEGGGGLLLMGDVPVRDERGRSCRLLADALGVEPGERTLGGPGVFPSVQPSGWARDLDEVRCGRLTRLRGGEPVLLDAGSGAPCGVEVAVGAGRAIVLAADEPTQPEFFRRALARLGVVPAFEIEGAAPGLLLATTATPAGARFLHLVNTDGWAQHVVVRERGRDLFPVELAPRSGVIRPL